MIARVSSLLLLFCVGLPAPFMTSYADERDPTEVKEVFGTAVAPAAADATNIAFDVTPNELVSAIITDVGVLEAPFEESIAAALRQGD